METVTPKFIGQSTNYIFAGTGELRDVLQTILLDNKKMKIFEKATREKLAEIISSNLLKRIGGLDRRNSDIRKKVLNLPAHQRQVGLTLGSTPRPILNELVDRCLVLGIERDFFSSSTCLLAKEDLNELGIALTAFGQLIENMNCDWAGGPKMTWGFCDRDNDGKSETEPYVWVGFAFGTKLS